MARLPVASKNPAAIFASLQRSIAALTKSMGAPTKSVAAAKSVPRKSVAAVQKTAKPRPVAVKTKTATKAVAKLKSSAASKSKSKSKSDDPNAPVRIRRSKSARDEHQRVRKCLAQLRRNKIVLKRYNGQAIIAKPIPRSSVGNALYALKQDNPQVVFSTGAKNGITELVFSDMMAMLGQLYEFCVGSSIVTKEARERHAEISAEVQSAAAALTGAEARALLLRVQQRKLVDPSSVPETFYRTRRASRTQKTPMLYETVAEYDVAIAEADQAVAEAHVLKDKTDAKLSHFMAEQCRLKLTNPPAAVLAAIAKHHILSAEVSPLNSSLLNVSVEEVLETGRPKRVKDASAAAAAATEGDAGAGAAGPTAVVQTDGAADADDADSAEMETSVSE